MPGGLRSFAGRPRPTAVIPSRRRRERISRRLRCVVFLGARARVAFQGRHPTSIGRSTALCRDYGDPAAARPARAALLVLFRDRRGRVTSGGAASNKILPAHEMLEMLASAPDDRYRLETLASLSRALPGTRNSTSTGH